MGMPPARLGIVYPPRGLVRFAALVGESRARELFLTARTLTGQEAAGWGLLDHVVETDEVRERALAIAAEMAQLAPLAVQGTRRAFELLLRQRAALPDDAAAEVDALRAAAWASRDAAEALAALAAKRPPVFEGE